MPLEILESLPQLVAQSSRTARPSAETPLALTRSFVSTVQSWIGQTDLTLLALQAGSALLAGVAVYFGLSYVLRVVGRRLTETTTPQNRPYVVLQTLGRLITRTSGLFVLIVSLTAASLFLPLPEGLRVSVHTVFVIAFVVQAALWASTAFNLWLEHLALSRQSYATSTAHRDALANATGIMGALGRGVLWGVALLLILDNLGFNITTLVAGLGIGGIAVGLAAQKILGDLFASLAILLDKPFEYGDFIVAGDQVGTVERIGLKTTRLRSLSGEQIIISNADLLESRIQNYKRMAERRVVFSIGVVYGTSLDKLKLIPEIIKAAIESQDKVRFDRSNFIAYGDSSLNFETAYYILSADYTYYVNTHQAVLFEIYRRFSEEEIGFAFPTQTLHIETLPEIALKGGAADGSPGTGIPS